MTRPPSVKSFSLWIFSLLAVISTAQLSALEVSGPLTVNTTWSIADSPITVVDTISVNNGAVLSVDAGVQVRFATGKKLILTRGAIRAIGTASLPIVFASAAASGAPGDWGPLELQNGTSDAATVLENAVIRHGKGLSITQASPALNRVSFENNLGAAISLDLESSPTGIGLSAVGNGLNGILIPPGTITGSVRWGLVGIPYVVQQGIVTIGLPPLTLTPTSMDLRIGQSREFTLRLAKPAPPGGMSVDVVSSVPGVASVPSTITVLAGMLEARFNLNALSVGNSNISVSRPELGAVSAEVTVRPRVSITLSPANTIVAVGQQVTVVVQLSEPAPPAGVNIQLVSSNSASIVVPTQVQVSGGNSVTNFQANTLDVGTSTITASATGGYSDGIATISAKSAFLSFGPIGIVAPGAVRQISVQLSHPAPQGGLDILLTTNPGGIITIPASIRASQNATVVNFTLTGSALGSTQLTATAPNYDTAITTVNVETVSLSFDPSGPAAIPIGTSDQFTIRSSRTAPAGGISVALTASAQGFASITPSEVVITEGSTASGPVVIAGVRVNAGLTVSAASPGVISGSLALRVLSAPELRFDQASLILGKGLRSEIQLIRYLAGGVEDYDQDSLVVTLTSSDPARLGVPSTVTIPGGLGRVTVAFSAFDTGSQIQVTASAAGYSTGSPLSANIVRPIIEFISLDESRLVGSARDGFQIRIRGLQVSGVAIQPIRVNLTVLGPAPADVVDGLYANQIGGAALTELIIPTGRDYPATSSGNPISAFVGTPARAGNYRISAQISGQLSHVSGLQSVLEGTRDLVFSATSDAVGLGLSLDKIRIIRRQSGIPFHGALPLVIGLGSSDTSRVSLPDTVEIPAGQTEVNFQIIGLAISSTPTIISASAAGYQAPANSLSVGVVMPQIYLGSRPGTSFSTQQSVGDPRNMFMLSWTVPGSSYEQGSSVDRPVSISLVDQTPSGTVAGFFEEPDGPTPLSPLILMAGTRIFLIKGNNERFFYIGSPYFAGSYRLSVVVAGMGAWQSSLVNVTQEMPQLRIYYAQQVVGLGLQSRSQILQRVGFSIEDPLTVNLVSSDPSKVMVPSSVSFASGDQYVDVPISGISLTSTLVNVTASVPTHPDLSVSWPTSVVNPLIYIAGLGNIRYVGDMRDEFGVCWSVPSDFYLVGEVATTVSLALLDVVPSDVVSGLYAAAAGPTQRTTLEIPAGQGCSTTAGQVPEGIFIGSPSAVGSYRIRAEVPGMGAWNSGPQSISAPSIEFSTSQLQIVGTGMRSTSVSIRRSEATASDLVISLACTSPSICDVPATIILPADARSVDVPITGVAVGSTRIRLSAPGHLIGVNSELDVRVIHPKLALSGVPGYLFPGVTAGFNVRINVPGSFSFPEQQVAGDVTINLTSAVPSVASVTTSFVIPSGANSGSGNLLGIASGFTTVTASSPNVIPVTSATVTVTE